MRTLLDADPDLFHTRRAGGATAVQWAVYTRHPELAPLLLGTRAPDFFDSCALGDTARAAELLASDPALANAPSRDGFTGLGLSCFFWHIETATFLLDHGADPNVAATDALGVAPLHSAIAAGMGELAALLLDRGANPNAREAGGLTPLHTAAATGNREMVARLLQAGRIAMRGRMMERLPADFARQYGHTDVV